MIPQPSFTAPSSKTRRSFDYGWVNVILAALLMLATLPGRTQGLGLITESLLRDLHIDRIAYANINLWATLLGALFCFPAGYLIDRFGVRPVATAFVLLLSLTVWRMSSFTGGIVGLFVLLLLTRALGQSALSVVSITAVGKSFGRRSGPAMGIYSFLLSIFFVMAFIAVGATVTGRGWRVAWVQIAVGLAFVVAPLSVVFLRENRNQADAPETDSTQLPGVGSAAVSFSLQLALRTPAFWIFGLATAMFGLVSSGLGLFNEAVLAEHGFDQTAFHNFLAVTTLAALIGQLLCGWLALRRPMRRLMGIAMLLYSVALVWLPFVKTFARLWTFAVLIGVAGGFITVMFFAIWGHAFGRAHLGRIQGAAQILTVLASAIGPLLFAKCAAATGSYTPLLLGLAVIVMMLGIAAWNVSMPKPAQVGDGSVPAMAVVSQPQS
ncbi:MAG: Major facilitator superfamily 1 [Pedosphaera sp.]|nr:Major facilitator superfamily 1 [Pedosphaera sp.]